MNSTSNHSFDQAALHRLVEPDLAAWAEKITIDSAKDRRGLWYGALVFWIVVACIIAARVAFLDPSRIQPATANSAAPSVLAGGASSVPPGAKLWSAKCRPARRGNVFSLRDTERLQPERICKA
jgi:hypothetical protein